MKIRTVDYKEPLSGGDLLFVLSFEGTPPSLGKAHAAAMRAVKATGDLPTKARLVRVFHPGTKAAPTRLALVGMGARTALDTEALRRAGAVIQARAEALEVGTFQVLVDVKDHKGIDAFTAGKVLAEGAILGAYRYQPPRKDKPKARKGQRAEFLYRGKNEAEFKKGVKHGSVAAAGTVLARDVENMPGNLATPTYLAKQAQGFHGKTVKVKILEEKDMTRLGMNALLGVSRGSVEPAKLIVMDYNPKGAKETVCVVGKGLTFDSGGISLKPGARMDEMRYDMCGGGAVLGLFHAIANGGLQGSNKKVRVIGVVPSSENMPDADAQKPGDVVTAMNGTTIEILNTDAEGRLILADALAYAVKTFKPDQIVDLATLTGAVVVALGHEVAAVMGSDEGLIDSLIDAGKETDESLWELPLWDVHCEQIKSKFADIANLNSPSHGNGSISGGAFLSFFVGDTPWAHMDIAGTAYGARAKDYYRSGAVGTKVRMLLQWLRGKK